MPRFDGRWFPGSSVSDWSAGKFGTPGWYPDAPTIDSATYGDGTVALEWTAGDANGLDITGYQIEKNDGSWSVAVADTASTSGSHTVTGLTNGTAYTFRLKAINSLGASESPSTASASQTPRGLPAAPTSLAATDHASTPHSHIELAWSAGSANGAAITGYKIQRKTGSGGTYANVTANTGNTNVTYTDSGLTAETDYYYRVAAINSEGAGSYSNEDNNETGEQVLAYTTSGSPTTRTYTYNSVNYKSVQWTGSGSITFTSVPAEYNGTFDFFVVAGGGGGGYYYAGGGGGGGMRIVTSQTVTANTYSVSVGAGGNGHQSTNGNGLQGSGSSITGSGITNTSCTGGGGGCKQYNAGGSGGSGGGSNYPNSGGATVSYGQEGNTGGGGYNSYYSQYSGSGGGGGKGGSGGNAATTDGGYTAKGGNGGNGVTSLFANGTATLAGRDGFSGGGPGSGYGGNGSHNALYGTGSWNSGADNNVANSGAGGSGYSGGSGQTGASGTVVLRWVVPS